MVVFCDHRPIAFFCQPSQLYQSDDATPQYDQMDLKAKSKIVLHLHINGMTFAKHNIQVVTISKTLVKPSCETSMVISVHMDANPTSMSADEMCICLYF